MIIMVINAGSSSLKYSVYDMDSKQALAKGLCERIGIDGKLRHEPAGKARAEVELPLPTHRHALEAVISHLTGKEHGVLQDIHDIHAVGHRVGHGGEFFSDSVRIDERVKDGIRAVIPLAPLHNPNSLNCIDACEAVLGASIPQVAVCDTAFHQSLPRYAYTYALPKDVCKKYNLRRYGFHGTSHKYVAEQAATLLGKDFNGTNIVTCHLGNGASIAAIQKGRSIDTSMGFVALEGVIMGTRCGDIDPILPLYLIREAGYTPEEAESMLYKQSGLFGISGISPDLRDIEKAAAEGNADAQNAIDVLCYGIRKYIGAYMAALGGADIIVFTAGVGENSTLVRAQSLAGLERMGIVLDTEKNAATRGAAAVISKPESPIAVVVMPTDEEWVIASDTLRILS